MIKAWNLNFKLIFTLFLLLVIFLGVKAAYAQEDSPQAAKKYNITFPVAELGNCTDISSCRSYCEDPLHQKTCVNFAKKKGFYKESAVESRKTELLQVARSELGCTSEDACREACHKQENFDKCDAFAKKHGINGGHTEDLTKKQIIQKAKEVLGCDSEVSCKNICSQESNREKCSNFAKQAGLRGGEEHRGAGGCTSEETCKAFCSDPNNFQVCREFASANRENFSGPGGCNSEDSCKAYCKDHPKECGEFGGGGAGNDKKRAEAYAKFCRENPQKCGPGQGGFGNEQGRKDFEEYCRQTPQKCAINESGINPNSPSSESQEAACRAGGGTCVSWVNGACGCERPGGSTSQSPSTPQPAQTSTPQDSSAPQQPQPSSAQPSPSVQGISVGPNILQVLWNVLFSNH